MSYTNRNVTRTKHFKMVRGDTFTFGVKLKLVGDNPINSAYFSISKTLGGDAIFTKKLDGGIWIDRLNTINVHLTANTTIPPLSEEYFSIWERLGDETPPEEKIAPKYKYSYLYKSTEDCYDYRINPEGDFLYPAGTYFVWNGYRYILASDYFRENSYMTLDDYLSGIVFALGVHVDPAETADLLPGIYYYDFQLGIGNAIRTIMRGTLTMDLEVTVL